MKFADRVSQLKPSLTLAITSKAKAMKKKGVDVVSFGAGEPDFDTPLHIKTAAIKSINRGFTKYTPASGIPELKKAISGKLKKDNSLDYSPDQIIISCGAKHALYNIFQVLCDKGDEVITISPFWVSYPEMVALSGAKTRIVEASEQTAYVVNPAHVALAVSKRTKAIIVNSPSNPTGAVFNTDVLKSLAKIVVEKNIFVISDEVYEKLVYDPDGHVSIGSLGKEVLKRTLTVNGVSKSYSMTGWRIGYVAGPEEIIRKIGALQSHSTSNPTSISQVAALEAISGGETEVLAMKKEFLARRDYMVRRISSMPGLSCVESKGAFYLFCNISGTKLDSLTFSDRLLEEAHVACVPGIAFGSDKHVRLSFATSMENIEKGLDRIENWLKHRQSQI